MSDDTVYVSIRGERAIPVSRHNLSNEMKIGASVARRRGIRVGEPSGIANNENLSTDVISTIKAVVGEVKRKTS